MSLKQDLLENYLNDPDNDPKTDEELQQFKKDKKAWREFITDATEEELEEIKNKFHTGYPTFKQFIVWKRKQ